jgi:hypothetical protein
MEAGARELLEDAEEAAADEASDGGGGDDGPAAFVVEEVALAGALVAIEGVGERVAEGLEDGVELRVEEVGQVVDSVAMYPSTTLMAAPKKCRVPHS